MFIPPNKKIYSCEATPQIMDLFHCVGKGQRSQYFLTDSLGSV